MPENIDTRSWHRRIGTLNGLFWGILIAACVVAYVRHHVVEQPTDLLVAQYILLFFGACIPSLPIGVFLSCRLISLGRAKTSGSYSRPATEMTDTRFLLMLHLWESATALFLLIALLHRLWPVVPHVVVALAMTFSIVASLFVSFMAGWAAYVRRGRYYGWHAGIGIILTVATLGVWILFLRPVNAG